MDIEKLSQQDINLEIENLKINGVTPVEGVMIPNKPNLMGKSMMWKTEDKLYRIIPIQYGENGFSYELEVYDRNSGKYLNDMDKLFKKEFDSKNKPVENLKLGLKELKKRME
jgi:hypothetical protein